MSWFEKHPVWSVALLALGLRLWLIFAYPPVFGGDSVVRLANADRILISYQLPGLQAIVYAVTKLAPSPLGVRLTMALIGAAAAVGFWLWARWLIGEQAGLYAALLFATNPFIAAFSTVPYQEILMLAGLFFAFALHGRRREGWASAALGLACLTRYEAWIAAAALWIDAARRGPRSVTALLGAALLYGWAPLLWIAMHWGLTPGGTFAVEFEPRPERLLRWVYLGWITLKNTPPPVLALALAGGWIVLKRRDRRWFPALVFLGGFLIAILLSAHGERDQPDRFVTAREAHVLLAGVALPAGLGLTALPRYRALAVGVSVLMGAWMADRFVAREVSDPNILISYQAAVWLDRHAAPGETAAVLAAPVPRDLIERYLSIAERRGGAPARAHAVETLLQTNVSPPGYQRILVQSRLGKQSLLSASTLPPDLVGARPPPDLRPDLILRWSDFQPSNPAEQRLAEALPDQEPVKTFAAGELRLDVFRLGGR